MIRTEVYRPRDDTLAAEYHCVSCETFRYGVVIAVGKKVGKKGQDCPPSLEYIYTRESS